MSDRRCNFWFGTEHHSSWFPAPLQGADSSPTAWGTEGTLLNGGGYAFNSWGSHKRYTYEWASSSSPEVAQKMKSYRDGTYGRGLLYFLDPMIYKGNILPASWADPSMALDNEAPSLVYGVEPTAVATSGWETNGLPVTSARYNITTPAQTTPPVESSLFVPVPEGYTLYLGAFYSFTGTGGVFAAPVNANGTTGARVKLSPLVNNTAQLVNESFSGTIKGVRLWVGRTSTAASTVTLTAMIARLLKTSEVPVYGPWVEQARNLFTNPNLVGSGSVEVYRNLFTNPNLVGSGTWAEVRKNRFPNPVLSGNQTAGFTAVAGTGGAVTVGHAFGITPPPNVPAVREVRATWSTQATGGFPALVAPGVAVVAGEVLPFRLFARRGASGVLRLRATSFGDGGVAVDAVIVQTSPTLPAVGWYEFTGSYTVPVGATKVEFGISPASGEYPAATHWMSITCMTTDPQGSIFDGSTKPTDLIQPEDFRTRWLGAENASESVLEIETVRGMSASDAIAGASTWEGKPAIRLIPKAVGNNSFAEILVPAPARGSGTLLATMHLNEPLSGSLNVNALRLRTIAPDVTTPGSNTVGSQELRHTFSVTSLYRALFMHGGAQGSGDVWWTDIGLFAGTYNGPWFSGAASPDSDLTASWSGAVNNSESILSGVPVSGLDTGVGVLNIRSSKFGGSLRQIPTSQNSTSFSVILIPPGALPVGTAVVTHHQEAPLTGSLWSYHGRPYVVNPTQFLGDAAPNSAGSTPFRSVYNVIGNNRLVLPHGGVQGSGDVYWSMPGLFAGVYDGPWFSATTPGDDLNRYRWAGATNNSESIYETRTLTGSPAKLAQLQAGPWIGGQGHSGARFSGTPTYISNSPYGGGRVGFAATFLEVGDSLYS